MDASYTSHTFSESSDPNITSNFTSTAAPPLNTMPSELHAAYPSPIPIPIEEVTYPSDPRAVYSPSSFYYYSNTEGPGPIPPPLPFQTTSGGGPHFLDSNASTTR